MKCLWHINRHILINLGTLEALIQQNKKVLLCCPKEQYPYCRYTCRAIAQKQVLLTQNSSEWNIEISEAQILWYPFPQSKEESFSFSETLPQFIEEITWMTLCFRGGSGKFWHPQQGSAYPLPLERCVMACEVLKTDCWSKKENEEMESEVLEQSFLRLQKVANTLC